MEQLSQKGNRSCHFFVALAPIHFRKALQNTVVKYFFLSIDGRATFV